MRRIAEAAQGGADRDGAAAAAAGKDFAHVDTARLKPETSIVSTSLGTVSA